jgi:hypothetical protein
MAKKTRRPELQTPSLALSPSNVGALGESTFRTRFHKMKTLAWMLFASSLTLFGQAVPADNDPDVTFDITGTFPACPRCRSCPPSRADPETGQQPPWKWAVPTPSFAKPHARLRVRRLLAVALTANGNPCST